MLIFLVGLLKGLQELQPFLNMLKSIGASKHSNGVFCVRNVAGGFALGSILCSVRGVQASTCSALAVTQSEASSVKLSVPPRQSPEIDKATRVVMRRGHLRSPRACFA